MEEEEEVTLFNKAMGLGVAKSVKPTEAGRTCWCRGGCTCVLREYEEGAGVQTDVDADVNENEEKEAED